MDTNKRESDRRGDRRGEASRCNAMLSSYATGQEERGRCGGELAERIGPAGVFLYCGRCGTVDRRGTEGSRRRAELELRALCERIERELADARERLVEMGDELAAQDSRSSTLESRLEERRRETYQLERKVDAVEYTADEAKREAARALQEAERAGRGW